MSLETPDQPEKRWLKRKFVGGVTALTAAGIVAVFNLPEEAAAGPADVADIEDVQSVAGREGERGSLILSDDARLDTYEHRLERLRWSEMPVESPDPARVEWYSNTDAAIQKTLEETMTPQEVVAQEELVEELKGKLAELKEAVESGDQRGQEDIIRELESMNAYERAQLQELLSMHELGYETWIKALGVGTSEAILLDRLEEAAAYQEVLGDIDSQMEQEFVDSLRHSLELDLSEPEGRAKISEMLNQMPEAHRKAAIEGMKRLGVVSVE